MTTKERLHQIIDTWDDSRVEALLVVLEPSNGASNGHDSDEGHVGSSAVWVAFVADREAEVQQILAIPPEERTPFQEQTIISAELRAARAGTPEGDEIEASTRRSIEAIAAMPPITADDPIWDLVGMIKREPGEPITNIAENHDEYLAEAYADLHDDDPQ